MKEQPGIMIYREVFDCFEGISAECTKELLMAIKYYVWEQVVPKFEHTELQTAWFFIRSKLDHDIQKYRDVCEKNSEAGKISAASRKARAAQASTSVDTRNQLQPQPELQHQPEIQKQQQQKNQRPSTEYNGAKLDHTRYLEPDKENLISIYNDRRIDNGLPPVRY